MDQQPEGPKKNLQHAYTTSVLHTTGESKHTAPGTQDLLESRHLPLKLLGACRLVQWISGILRIARVSL